MHVDSISRARKSRFSGTGMQNTIGPCLKSACFGHVDKICVVIAGSDRQSLSEFRLPEAVKVTVFVHGNRFFSARTDDGFRLVCKVDSDSASLGFKIDEAYVVLRCHRMRYASNFNLELAIVKSGHDRNMLLYACICCVRNKFLHLFSTADYRNLRVN